MAIKKKLNPLYDAILVTAILRDNTLTVAKSNLGAMKSKFAERHIYSLYLRASLGSLILLPKTLITNHFTLINIHLYQGDLK